MELKELTVNDIKKIEVDILRNIDSFCKEHNLKYFLLGGTLLGAVRHRGFIPWDDDIDIGMPREDYDTFCRIFKLPNLDLHLPGEKKYPYPFAKVTQKNSVIYELENSYQGYFGVYVDIFPLNEIPDDLKLRQKYFKKLNNYKYLISIKTTLLSKKRNFLKTILLLILKFLFVFVPVERLVLKVDKYVSSFNNCDFIGNSSWGYGIRETTKKYVFSNTTNLPFEGHSFPAPSNYDEWLTNVFGDYMKMPPEEKRVSNHNFKAYIKE